MHQVTIFGAGKIGSAIAKLLHHSGDYAVRVGDTNPQNLEQLAASVPVETILFDAGNEEDLVRQLQGQKAVVSACPFSVNLAIAKAALKTGVSYFDLTEDVETTQAIRLLAEQASQGQIFMPQSGLAPGFISILAHHLCQDFELLQEVKMRVGALPRYPSNRLKYNLTWSTEGLINEYSNAVEAIIDGRRIKAMPLEGLESFSLDGIEYEAFNTSGNLGTLAETLQGRVRNLNYKSVRHQGHCDLMSFLLKDLGLGQRRELLKDILEKAVPTTKQDVVLIFGNVQGIIDGQLLQVSDARKIYHTKMYGEDWSAIALTTAAGLCAVLDLYLEGSLPKRGFVKQEEVKLQAFLANRFGRYYAQPED